MMLQLPFVGLPLYFTLIIIFLILAPIIAISLHLLRYKQALKAKEQALDEHYEQKNKEVSERKGKLYNMYNRLFEEIAKHEITEELLKETQDYLQSIINSMPSILIGVNKSGDITHWNTAAQAETQISHNEALGKPLFNMIDIQGINLSVIQSAIDKKAPQRREAVQNGHGSHARYKDITIYPLHTLDSDSAVIRIDDVTSRIRLENMIIQNEKMGSLGELAAGVAHEINNPLSTMLQSIQNIQRRLSDALPENTALAKDMGIDLQVINNYLEKRKITSFIEEVKEAGERAAKIVTNMLEFSRSHTNWDTINLVELLNRSIDLSLSATSALKSSEMDISILRDFPDDTPLIYGSAVELQQVRIPLKMITAND
ncbi:hypothetical protein AB835_14955 [Candidatus Endobugula sertula]|uniref:histidine kinase n=1 Tax=Candidatus Endobugula sertula TaxID=62101 RepID=A0A1D2QL55_9GAMM|nr:hypothetical protein AB835_14955 [Candidatus Endobugula sertula]